MRTILVNFLVCSLLLNFGIQVGRAAEEKNELKGTVTISGAWALYPMAVKWAEEFQKIHPKVKIDVAAGGAGKGMVDCLAQVVDMGMVSREIFPEEIAKGAWWVSVVRDAVVATMSENNPALNEVIARGIKREEFVDIWITGKIKNWNELVSGKTPYLINVYTRSDACGAAEVWAKYLGKNQENLLGVGVYGDPGLAEAVRNDKFGIGFNNINYVYDAKTKEQVKGIRVIPIDLNNDGQTETEESFYNNRDEVVNAIATGKYPSPPARDLHFVSYGRPNKEIVREFIKWVLVDGQRYVPECGYINLSNEKLASELKKLQGE
jgi:phosphate transport system substrate-binding protein